VYNQIRGNNQSHYIKFLSTKYTRASYTHQTYNTTRERGLSCLTLGFLSLQYKGSNIVSGLLIVLVMAAITDRELKNKQKRKVVFCTVLLVYILS